MCTLAVSDYPLHEGTTQRLRKGDLRSPEQRSMPQVEERSVLTGCFSCVEMISLLKCKLHDIKYHFFPSASWSVVVSLC